MSRRVVVTGMGIVLPGGYNVKSVWDKITNSVSFVSNIDNFDSSIVNTKIAAEIKWQGGNFEGKSGHVYENLFNPEEAVDKKEVKRMDKFIIYGIHAADQAVLESGINSENINKDRVGVLLGSGIGGLATIEDNDKILHSQGIRKISPFFIPSVLINLISGQVSMKYGFRGPNFGVVSACATAGHGIGEGARAILCDDADIMVVGGAESAISPLGIAGFNALRALSTNNDNPTSASRPWDRDRDGFVMGEGAAVLVLEEYEHAKKRGAKIYCELAGYGASADAYHLTAPHPEGDGALAAMKIAINKAKINPSDINYINAHGTSTPMGDEIEVKALKRLLGENAKNAIVSSTKSATGHLLGAAAAIEAVFSIMAIETGIIPPTLNLENPSDGCDLDFCPKTSKKASVKTVLSNSFGFGGCNASLLFKKVE
ncbi:beta-ketoacyl-ACP synthase II [Candidatus Deianiraea vastatrix]|nr:beta-ketoacyl-ACP synthase II [Candidatus Deianiraea vastatrix]